MSGKLKDKVIIVTGGAGLIGKHIVEACQKEGAITVNVDINNTTNLAEGIYGCDLTDKNQIQKLVEEVSTFYEKIDGLVNNAYPRTKDWGNRFEEISYESWQQNVDMQLNAVFLLCQKVLEKMKANQSGSIVNIASIYGVVGNDFTIYEGYGGTSPAAYSAIKGGIINLTKYLASYFGPYSIRINCVSPGGILDKQHPSFIERYEYKSPLKRMGRADEIGAPVVFLLSEDASFITGHNLMVDGGWTAI